MKRFAVSLLAIAVLALVSFAFPVFETVSVVSSRIAAYFSQTPEAATPIRDGNAPSLASDLFISEYIEGSSNNKAIEIYNATGAPVNLATGNYVLQVYFNGATTASTNINLDGIIANGDVYVFAHNLANATILAQADNSSSTLSFNGDDAVVLRKGGTSGTIIDSFGQVGFDPGTEWGTGLTSTADNTLTRKSTVCSGDTNSGDVFDPSIQWDGFATDTFSNLGSHTSTCLAAPEIEIEELFSGVILDGGTFNFGTQNTTSSATRTFVIHNNGTATLNLGGNLFTNTSGSGVFVITSPYSGTVAPGGTTTFQLQFTPGPGASTATMNIANNDADESPYNIVLQGFGNVPPECTASTINGAINTLQHSIDLDTVCIDSDGTIQSIQINSVTGGPAPSTAFANQTTHVVSLTPGNPGLPTSAVSPYVVSYTVFDDSIGSTSSTITIYVFDPPATLTTNAATSVTSTTATLNATVTSGVLFSPITARFHYGTTDPGICSDLFGTRAPTSGGSTIGGGGAFSENITGLTPGTTYYVCTLATNTGGTRVGNVQSFTTSGNLGVLSFDPISYSPGEGGTATVTVTRTGGSSGAVSVDFGASAGVPPATGGAACAFGTGVDYINVSGTLNFADGETSKTFDVVTCNDGLFEGTESVSFSLSNAQGGATIGGSSTATVNILDDPIDFQPTIQFSMTDFNFSEGGNATVTVTRMFSPEHQLTVNYAALVGGGSNPATPGACGSFSGNDFVPTSGTLTFLPGEDTKTFDVTLCDDGLFEPTESIAIALNTVSAPGVLSTPNTGRINILENDTAPTVEFSEATSSVGEGAGSKTFTVNRTGATENSFSVNFATANGTALSGSCGSGGDYVSNSGTLNFAGGDPNKTFNVTICEDGLFEGDETFSATLSSPTGVAVIGTNGTETATISENDLTPLIQFSTDRYPGTEGTGVTVSIVRTGALDNDVTADLNAGAGAGAACGQPGVDYELSNVTVHFAPGETLKQFGVPLCWEFLYEGSESWDLQLSIPTGGANIGSQSFAFIDITDSDTPPKFAFSSSAVSVPENTGTVTLNVNRTGASQNVVSVDYATSGGTATGGNCLSPGSDFLIQTGQLDFAAGDTSKTFNITICDDAEFEGDESFTVSLSNPQFPSQLGTVTTETVTILANDSVPEMDVLGNSVSIPDGDTTPSPADHTDFGAISAASGTVSRTFTIANTGTGNLDLTGTPKVEISGTNAADFSVTVQPGSPVVGPSGTTTFTVVFDPSAVGLRTATLSIANNDPDENPYDFSVQGTGTAPVASFTATPNPTACNQLVGFNASGSTQADPNRPIVSYSWDFGDGQNGTGVSPTHAYGGFGTYTVVLTVTDDVGAQDTESLNVTVSLGNQPPVASTGGPYIITSGNGVSLNGTGSTDPNSGCGDSIVVYEWDLDNDGQFDDAVGASPNLSAATVTSLFPTLNTPYTIGLRVIDEFGSQGTASTTLAVYQNAPIAAFTAIPNPAACNQTINFNGTGSSHPNPTRSIVSYSWDFGDTTSGTGSTTTHAYSAFGTFNAVLTVTDNTGAQDTESLSVTVNQGNQPPVANSGGPYSAILGSGIGVSFNGSGSTDPNTGCGDSIVSYAWNIASGTYNLTGSNPSLTYAQIVGLGAGSHPVQLTVTDEFGATGVSNTTLTVSFNVTLVVDNLTDNAALNQCTAAPGDCSLRGANSIANNGDTIAFDPAVFNLRSEAPTGSLTIDLVNGQILIDNNITINGPGANLLTIKRNSVSNFRIFAVNPGITANISGLTISNGFGSGAAPGGGIYNDHGTVTITDCVISGNFGPGAGIYNDGNTSGTASLTITNSTISGNNSNFNGGGGIFNTAHFGGNAQVSITNSTISDNISEDGGGFFNNSNGGTALLTMTNSTISGNTATRFGGGGRNDGSLVLTNVTVTNNRGNSDGDVTGDGGGIRANGGTITLKSTIVAGNYEGASPGTTASDVVNSVVDPTSSFNLIGTGGSGGLVDGVNSNQVGVADARLGPLQNNGGPVFTHGFNNSGGLSPAIDKGSSFGSSFDSRGLPRTVDLISIPNATGGDGTDIGAYEFQAPTAASVSISGRVRTIDGRGLRGAIVSITDGNGMIRQTTTSTFGYYRFEGVTAGESYVVGVASKRYRFTPIFVNVTDELRDLDFYPEP